MGVTLVLLVKWSRCLIVLWMVTPHILVLVILEWECSWWFHKPEHCHVEWTRGYLVGRDREWSRFYLLLDRR